MNDFEAVRGKLNILELIRSETGGSMKKVGINTFNLESCPFCGGHDCFRINQTNQLYNCFQCDAGGNIFSFIQDLRKISPKEALEYLAPKAGHVLSDNGGVEKEQGHLRRREIFRAALDFYHQALLAKPEALTWLSDRRGHSLQTVADFNLGYTTTRRNALYNHLQGKFKLEDLIGSGLVRDRDGEVGDIFPPRVFIYPHFIGGRISHFTFKDPRKKLQWQLASQFKLDGHLFYNQNAFYHDQVVLVEGENDLITAARVSGEKNIAAILGQISEEQIQYMRRMAKGKRIYCCFDNDKSGLRYTEKVISELTGTAQVYVITVPGECKDIDEYLREVKTDPAMAWFDLIENATDGLQHQIENLPDAESTIRISQIISPVLERLARLNDDILVEGYLEVIGRKYPRASMRAALRSRIKKLQGERQLEYARKMEVPEDDFGLIEHNNCYWKKTADGGTSKISEFVIKLRKIFVLDSELHYECILKNSKSQVSEPVVFAPEERAGLQQFRQKCISMGSYYYYGQQAEVYRIWQYEENQANIQEIIHYIQKYGFLEEHNLWLFENCAVKNGRIYEIGQDGIIKVENKGLKSKDVLVYSGDVPTLNITDEFRPDFRDEVIENFHTMIDEGRDDSFKSFIALGFIAATLYLTEIGRQFKCFPFLYSFGPSGTGKSAVMSLLLSMFGFDGRSEPWESATPDGTFKFMEQLSSLPGWYDEYLNSNDRRAHKMLGITKNIYNRIGAGKGGLRKRQINVVNGCLWISGEDSPVDKGLLSRCVIIRFTEITDKKTAAYNWLLDHQSRLSTLVLHLLKGKKRSTGDELIANIIKVARNINDSGVSDNRTALNYAIPAAAFYLFDYHKYDKEFSRFLVGQAQADRQRKEEEDIVTRFFEDVSFLVNQHMTRDTVEIDRVDNILYICFSELYNNWVTFLRSQGNLNIFKKSTMLDYLINKPYYRELKDNRWWFGKTRKRAVAFDLNLMPLELRILFDDHQKDEWA